MAIQLPLPPKWIAAIAGVLCGLSVVLIVLAGIIAITLRQPFFVAPQTTVSLLLTLFQPGTQNADAELPYYSLQSPIPDRAADAQPSDPTAEDLHTSGADELREHATNSRRGTTITFVGDIMLDRSIRQAGEKLGYRSLISNRLSDTLAQVDLVVGNLEGPVTEADSVSVNSAMGSPQNYQFTFSPESLEVLLTHNISLVNLGNNHANDYGAGGQLSTRAFLTEAGVWYFGYTSPNISTNRVYYWQAPQGAIAFVNYNQFVSGGLEAALADIASAADAAQFVVLYTHWGSEYQTTHNPALQQLALRFAEAGADLIIGTHQHVIAPVEKIFTTDGRQVWVYYSLGNFIFDQYFSPEVQVGMIVTAEFFFDTQHITTQSRQVRQLRTGVTDLD
jgi:poly-gamma-glutamate synthesis protein (capsule biosynthesis protein)